MVAEEALELRTVGLRVQHGAAVRIVQLPEEGHPQLLLEGLRAVGGDDDAVAVRPLGRRAAPLRQAREEAVPEDRREDEGVVAVAMAAEQRMARQGLQQDRGAGAREAADEDRRTAFALQYGKGVGGGEVGQAV